MNGQTAAHVCDVSTIQEGRRVMYRLMNAATNSNCMYTYLNAGENTRIFMSERWSNTHIRMSERKS